MNKRMFFIVVVCIGLAVVASASVAEEKRLSDEGELSYVNTGGNTEVTTLAVKNLVKYRFSEKLLGSWKVGALSAKTADVKTAESYFTDFKLDYQNTQRLYSFANVGWLHDKFAGVDKRVYGGLGEGYKFFDGPNNFLIGELSLMYVSDTYTDNTGKGYLGGRTFVKYTYAFTEKNKFSQSLEYLNDFKDSKNYSVNSETAIISALSGIFSLKTAYLVKYTHEPVPITLKKTDSILTVALVVNY
jgi:putative salt-induced outer membrane protein